MSALPIAVVGAGPAGMSCANALLSFGLTPVVIEQSHQVGGIQRANFHPNLWMLGLPGETGTEITERLARHFFELPLVTHLEATVRRIIRQPGGFHLDFETRDGPDSLDVAAVVLATGSAPRATPALRSLASASDRVIIGPLSNTIRDGIHGQRVAILGGGDNALDHALYLAERGNRVTVCARGALSARRQFLAACADRSEIELRPHALPEAIEATPEGIELRWQDARTCFDWLLVMFGYAPNTAILAAFAGERPQLTRTGHLHVDRGQRTSLPGIYAAGDVTDCVQPSVPSALAQGLAAARAIELDQATQST
ncbi:MAG: NAD(P)/FAD-dependent oxidoreductase [Pseudomonadota bacterium]